MNNSNSAGSNISNSLYHPQGNRRMFSTSTASESSSSIFDSAEFYQEEDVNEIVENSNAFVAQTPWIDENDTMGAFASSLAKDTGNLPTGVSTYGPYEYICYLDNSFYEFWMTAADAGGMGLCYGLMLTAFTTRVFLGPIALYS